MSSAATVRPTPTSVTTLRASVAAPLSSYVVAPYSSVDAPLSPANKPPLSIRGPTTIFSSQSVSASPSLKSSSSPSHSSGSSPSFVLPSVSKASPLRPSSSPRFSSPPFHSFSSPLPPSSFPPLASSSCSPLLSSSCSTLPSSSSSAPLPSSSSSFPQGTISSSDTDSSVSTGSTTKGAPTSTKPTPVYTDTPGPTDTYKLYTPQSYPIETSPSSGHTMLYELTTVSVEFTSTWATSSITTYGGEAHTTAFSVTMVFEPGAVITVGAIFCIDPKRSNVGPIVGGVVAGISGLIVIFLLYWCVLRQRSHKYNLAALLDPGRLSGIDRVVSGNPPDANFVIDEDGMGCRLAAGSETITPFIYDPLSIEMRNLNRAPIITSSDQHSVTSNSHRTIGTSPPGSRTTSTFSDAASVSSGGGYAGDSRPYQIRPSPGSFRSELNTISSDVYHPRSAMGVGLMHLSGAPTTNPNEGDLVPSRPSSPYSINTGGGAGMGDHPYPGDLQGGDVGLPFAPSTVLPPALRPGPRIGSDVVAHKGGGRMGMRINLQGVREEEEEEPASTESPPLCASLVPGQRR